MIKFKDLYVTLTRDDLQPDDIVVRDPQERTAKTTTNCVGGQLEHLKNYLVRALALAVRIEDEVDEGPQTVAEVEMLEEKLRGALDELRARKAELESEAA
jgi:hypothetical protein